MTTESRSATVTLLFTDLVNSTELLQRAGDEQAQQIFAAHHRLLRDAVAANGGQEVKWLGDGLMVAFPSAADAVRCAIAMQRASRRASGDRLDVRVGLNTGDTLRDETDYFGTPVVVAKRLCDRADAGQILCSALVSGLLAGRQAFAFRDIGAVDLKGIETPVAAAEVMYERDEPTAFVARTPFVGRSTETARLRQKLEEARGGRGGLVMLVGEPGIGKTRTCEEFADAARAADVTVLWGRCFEGEWAPPYGPFAEALEDYFRHAEPDALRADLGGGAPAIARLAPALRELLPDTPEPPALQPDEERFRLLDAVAQLLVALAARAPVLLVLDDLHWADRGTIAMLRHVARSAPAHRLLVLGAYRDVELDRQHPLADALGALRREAEYERIALKGLVQEDVGLMLNTIAEQDVNPALVQAISDETDGNPFFIREVLIHLIEEGKLYREEGEWKGRATTIAELGIPEGVRQVITRRLSRLSADANAIMTAASAFNGEFRFQTVAAVAGLDEDTALDAIDEALAAQLLRPARPEHYEFTHALIRHTLYGEMNPSRQVRLHRKIADVLEERVKSYTPERAASHAPELAYQYHRSSAIPGAERGVEHALAAADRAEAAYAHDEAAQFLGIALDLMPEDDSRRPRLLARYAVALAWTLRYDESVATAIDAGAKIAATEGDAEAANFLADAMVAVSNSGSLRSGWTLAEAGLGYIGNRRDTTWARLIFLDVQRREAENPDSAGSLMPLDLPETAEYLEVMRGLPLEQRPNFWTESREEASQYVDQASDAMKPFVLLFRVGDLRRAADAWRASAEDAERSGHTAGAAGGYAMLARCENARGDLAAAREAYQHSLALAGRLAADPLLGAQSMPTQQVIAALDEQRMSRGVVEDSVGLVDQMLAQLQPEAQWARASLEAAAARILAAGAQSSRALDVLDTLSGRLDRIPPWDANTPRALCDAAHALWLIERTDHLDLVERNLREKVIEPDFRYPMFDGRHAMAQLCALSGRFDEAREWFAKARAVLDEQGARPLRAIVDYDEALMEVRRGPAGDTARARELLDAALAQFSEIGMDGWTRRGEELRAKLR